jgi:hypothetical protein
VSISLGSPKFINLALCSCFIAKGAVVQQAGDMDFAVFVPHLLIDPPLVVRSRHPSRHFTLGMECLNRSTAPIPVLVAHFGHSLKPPMSAIVCASFGPRYSVRGTESVRGEVLYCSDPRATPSPSMVSGSTDASPVALARSVWQGKHP